MQGGAALYFFFLTLVVVAIVSPIAIWRYGAAVLSGMRQSTGGEIALPAPAANAVAKPASSTAARMEWERGARRRAVTAWLVATALAALPLATVYVVASQLPNVLLSIALVTATLSLVAWPPIALSLGWSLGEGLWRLLLYGVAASVLLFVLSIVNRIALGRMPSWDQLLNLLVFVQFAGYTMAVPLLMLLLSSPGRVRGVVPMTFGGLVIFGIGPFLASSLWQSIGTSTAGSQLMLQWSWLQSRHTLLLAIALPFALLMTWRLSALARAYAAKRFSDIQLLARAWWLMLVALTAIELINARETPAWAGAVAALCVLPFAPLQRVVFRRVDAARDAPPPATLLLLRVFGFRSRTERLFDRIGARWRWHGPVTMIAAPDVVSRTVDAVDFLGWLLGRSDESFVRNAEELQRKLAQIDTARDPDGRYRISEFCCADNTWRATVVELMHRADAVLMDLRGITAERKGCEFELQQLALRVPGARVVLVVEPGADRRALEQSLGAAAPQVQWVEMSGQGRVASRVLFERLLQASA